MSDNSSRKRRRGAVFTVDIRLAQQGAVFRLMNELSSGSKSGSKRWSIPLIEPGEGLFSAVELTG